MRQSSWRRKLLFLMLWCLLEGKKKVKETHKSSSLPPLHHFCERKTEAIEFTEWVICLVGLLMVIVVSIKHVQLLRGKDVFMAFALADDMWAPLKVFEKETTSETLRRLSEKNKMCELKLNFEKVCVIKQNFSCLLW